mmetsp:Transcript_21616/g.48909  ORF Transcript_21616/g.48909 Transcript_21616/m.48909 type:complete len:208 (-) Transcript_21616:532-1155(-)
MLRGDGIVLTNAPPLFRAYFSWKMEYLPEVSYMTSYFLSASCFVMSISVRSITSSACPLTRPTSFVEHIPVTSDAFKAFAIWIDGKPTPPPAATTSTRFPSSAPAFLSPCNAVSASVGAAAAVVREIPSGTLEHSSAGTVMYSERLPWRVDPWYWRCPNTSSPTFSPAVPSPVPSTVPLKCHPATSGLARRLWRRLPGMNVLDATSS